MRAGTLLSSVALLTLVTATGCSGTAVGTGTGSSGTSGASGFDVGNGGTSGEDTNQATATSAYDALFDAPASTTTTDNTLGGIWASDSGSYNDTRIVFGAGKITIAVRCSSSGPTNGLEVAAVVTASSIKTLASKSAPTPAGSYSSCALAVAPKEIKRCDPSDSYAYGCFRLDGTNLQLDTVSLFTGPSGGSSTSTYTKLSDATP